MSGSGRKRSSKWDLRDQPKFEDINAQDDGWPGKTGRSVYQRESGHGWQSPELPGSNGSKWSALDTNDIRSKHDSVFLARDTFSGSRGSHKNENIDKDCNRYVSDSMAWDADEDYGTRMSPGLDEWRQQHHSQSPKSGWSRSMRDRSGSRSRSRSRSRGRSRSPVRGLRRESGFLDRSRSRSGVSNQLCKDFTAGRCRRGNNCPFLHEDGEAYEDYWDSRHRKGGSSKYSTLDTRDYSLRSGRSSGLCNDFVKGRCRRGASCKFEHGASDGFSKGPMNEVTRDKETDRRRRDTSDERGVEHEARRNSDIPCKFFAAGNCRNGKHCRFSHHNQAYSSPDRKSQDKWALGRKSDDVNQAWDGPKWSDTGIALDAAKFTENISGNVGALNGSSTAWSMSERLGNRVNNENITSGADLNVSCEAAITNEKEPIRWKTDNVGAGMGLSEVRRTDKWLDDMDMSPDWNYAVPSATHVVKEEHSRATQRSESLNEMHVTSSKQSIIPEASGRINGAPGAVQPIIIEKSVFQPKHDLRDDSAIALPYDNNDVVRKTGNSGADLNIFDQNCQPASVFPFSNLNTIGQSQAVIPTEPQDGILKNLHTNTTHTEGTIVTKPDFREAKTSLMNSGIDPSQRMVNGEQVAHLTNLSASLVQLFGNGQQLPQLYAALNSNNPSGTPSFTSGSVTSTILPDAVIGPHKHYDPIQDSTDSRRPEVSNNTSAVLTNNTAKASDSDGKPEIQLKNITPSSFPVISDTTDCKQAGGLVEETNLTRQLLTSLEPNPSSKATKGKNELKSGENMKAEEETLKAEETIKVEETDPLDGEDKEGANDGKKNKDAKGVRAFKFALVEFVKELLKPTWKDGQIGKDAYKTIVKKVVDKVTGTMQGANIPQTQEKIDHYLSFSKAKLTKLVQAYVEKSQKG
ncbi:zinc finger CCCH domain-containing protein 38-like [Humulus lupulus]|uniref:zinc finger CCCH domain-containing protein 38-like n=1 Tax=Humulus lupulus TaxID=3486 RepID=UPI002B40D2B5|nr:zinc finger CCCH domain-containing protein 38-like [Humulus lupulus]XP_062096719.1 zinc finger CCCH domain-containing protein 38-like [Humulus lupulus]XP_062096723.1 zinc finger CCCH domain-containing protein 38-like [Humulus lupulus]XP_062096731.1 zinc finger CCCH domain-containing protein 38-like [Humulus lupulus]XP_062096737.1 zinc finger CCCH domain-containing protein 38-like [Humulus lupulus]XP_062096745.1 zinc finger CCCH domain-containing protein 38-like [Humulus lupulus]XP_06209675